jgi:hypothetical protein
MSKFSPNFKLKFGEKQTIKIQIWKKIEEIDSKFDNF